MVHGHGRLEGGHAQHGFTLADVLRTVTHRTVWEKLCGYWQGAAKRIVDQVCTAEMTVGKQHYLR